MWCEAFDSVGAVIDPAETRDGIFKEPFPFLAAAARGDFDDATREIAELRGERIGENSHGIDRGAREAKSRLAGKGIADRGIVDERVGLIGVAAFDADEAVGAAENSGKKRKGFLEVVVEADQRFQHGGGEHGAAGGSRGGVDTAGVAGDGDRFRLGLREKFGIDHGRSGRGESNFSSGGGEAGERDGELVIAGEDAGEGVLA